MAGTTYHSKAVGNVENIFFIAKDTSKDRQHRVNQKYSKGSDFYYVVEHYKRCPTLLVSLYI